jgi:UDP-glucose 4-epimerase
MSVLEMIALVSRVTGKEISYEIVSRRDGDLGTVYCDPMLIYAQLGFRAKVDLNESVGNAWRFILP